eukprot:TRINITY_DN2197_c0_g1_i1.p1 TRINITY_DN2197_c0_g1~~TRINITY_DN2197_c0_g1_i1.p1  ORF type:complete len:982 (+),score=203.01 TRINITY_DN2197_c0_g1_i1:102-3047(+)
MCIRDRYGAQTHDDGSCDPAATNFALARLIARVGRPHNLLEMTADAIEDEGGDEGRKRESESALEHSNAKRPRKSMGWGRGLVRKKVPEKKIESPSSSMVTAVLIAALSSSGAVSPPSKLQAAMRAVISNDAIAALSPRKSAGAEDDPDNPLVGSEGEADDVTKPGPEVAEGEPEQSEQMIESPQALKPIPVEVPLCKEELLLTIETTDSEIAKLEARLAELKEEEEAEQEHGDAARKQVLPFPAEYHVDFVDLRGQQMHSIYLQNTKIRIRSKRKQLLNRLMPAEVLEKVAAGSVLYQCPQDLPAYHENIASHKTLRLEMIEILMGQREAFKRKCNKLHRQWHLLNGKYENKQRAKSNAGSRSNSRGGRGSNARSGMRNNAISARGPRDTGVARSDMELNQIISELEEEERSRHRFEFNLAKIPAMIVDPRQREAQIFVSKNALVEDPVHENRIFSISDTWNDQEKKQFFDKYMSFPKNFRKIAASLPYKTTQDCIRFYYRYKKELDLKTKLKQHQLKKRPGKKGSGTVIERTPHKLEPPQLLGKHARDDDNADDLHVQNGQQAKKNKAENWTEQDKNRFIRHIKAIGKDWKKLSRAMGSGFSASDVQAYYECSHESIEAILDEQAQLKKEAEVKAKAKKEARRQAQQAMQQQQRQQITVIKPEGVNDTKQNANPPPVALRRIMDENMIDEWTRQHGAKPPVRTEPAVVVPKPVVTLVKPECYPSLEQPLLKQGQAVTSLAVPALAKVKVQEPVIKPGNGLQTPAVARVVGVPSTEMLVAVAKLAAQEVVVAKSATVVQAPAVATASAAEVGNQAKATALEEAALTEVAAEEALAVAEVAVEEAPAAAEMEALAVAEEALAVAQVAAEEARAGVVEEDAPAVKVAARVVEEEASAARVAAEEAPGANGAAEVELESVAEEGAPAATETRVVKEVTNPLAKDKPSLEVAHAPTPTTITKSSGGEDADDKVETLSEGIADDL